MSFHEELQQLDTKKLADALSAVVGKGLFEPGGQGDVASALVSHYRALSVMPDAITDILQQLDPTVDAQRLQDLSAGANFLASVLCEYAQLVELETSFPDLPRPE